MWWSEAPLVGWSGHPEGLVSGIFDRLVSQPRAPRNLGSWSDAAPVGWSGHPEGLVRCTYMCWSRVPLMCPTHCWLVGCTECLVKSTVNWMAWLTVFGKCVTFQWVSYQVKQAYPGTRKRTGWPTGQEQSLARPLDIPSARVASLSPNGLQSAPALIPACHPLQARMGTGNCPSSEWGSPSWRERPSWNRPDIKPGMSTMQPRWLDQTPPNRVLRVRRHEDQYMR